MCACVCGRGGGGARSRDPSLNNDRHVDGTIAIGEKNTNVPKEDCNDTKVPFLLRTIPEFCADPDI